jgi:circadian clock protein KaiB
MTTKRARPRTPTTRSRRPAAALARPTSERWTFRIYVTDHTPRSRNALQNLTDLCEAHFPGRYVIEVVDVLQVPERVRADDIVAVPTIVRTAPGPMQTVIGDLTDLNRATTGLRLSA